MKRITLAAMVLSLTMNVAFAQSKHVSDIMKIDAALPSAKISPAQRSEVVKLRNEGEKFHNEGKHGQAEAVLERAKSMLKI